MVTVNTPASRAMQYFVVMIDYGRRGREAIEQVGEPLGVPGVQLREGRLRARARVVGRHVVAPGVQPHPRIQGVVVVGDPQLKAPHPREPAPERGRHQIRLMIDGVLGVDAHGLDRRLAGGAEGHLELADRVGVRLEPRLVVAGEVGAAVLLVTLSSLPFFTSSLDAATMASTRARSFSVRWSSFTATG